MQHDPTQVFHFIAILLAFYGFVVLIGLAAVIIPLSFICKKAGFSPWLAFITLIFPIGGLVLLYVLAFADWKVVPAPQAFWPPPPHYPPPPHHQHPCPPYPPQPPEPPQS
jgi:hypothetical protein